mmetsp:Transcript_63591/g.71204  ORF Transcript_63591/g.71204 Transcript_63591/m.71204 type:complete len:106 (+) Transcript_63591:1-318(+)
MAQWILEQQQQHQQQKQCTVLINKLFTNNERLCTRYRSRRYHSFVCITVLQWLRTVLVITNNNNNSTANINDEKTFHDGIRGGEMYHLVISYWNNNINNDNNLLF